MPVFLSYYKNEPLFGKFKIFQISLLPTDSVILDQTALILHIEAENFLFLSREPRGLPRGELVLETQEWYFCRGLYLYLLHRYFIHNESFNKTNNIIINNN
jgi:hypothetical protein